MYNYIFIICFLFFSLLTPLKAQDTGYITGTVIDGNDMEPLPGATVLIEGTGFGAATNIDGEYFIGNIPPGIYDVRASIVGYSPQVVTDVEITAGDTTTVNFYLGDGFQLFRVTAEDVPALIDAFIEANDDTSQHAIITISGTYDLSPDADERIPFDIAGYTGLPPISTEIIMEPNGNHATIRRAPGLACTLNGTKAQHKFRIMKIRKAGKLLLKNITVANGCADSDTPAGNEQDGGGILNKGKVKKIKSNVSGNSANNRGGGVFVTQDGTMETENSTFSDNFSVTYGGAVGYERWGRLVQLEISGIYFSDNATGGFGGAVGVETPDEEGGNINVVSTVSVYENNHAASFGGGIGILPHDYSLGVGVNVVNFTGNETDGFGGGVGIDFSEGESQLLFIAHNALFQNNYAVDFGGAIAGQEPDIVQPVPPSFSFDVSQVNFIGNETGGFGGAVGIDIGEGESELSVVATESLFENNLSGTFGGAIGFATKDDTIELDVSDAQFTGNETDGFGGGIGIEFGEGESEFAFIGTGGEYTDNLSGSFGGAIGAAPKDDLIELDVSGAQFTGNETEGFGGAIGLELPGGEEGILIMNGMEAVFEGNVAADFGGGVGIEFGEGESELSFIGTGGEFSDNLSGTFGGAIGIAPMDDLIELDVSDAHFTGNETGGDGGAIAITDAACLLEPVQVNEATFLQNHASGSGGALYIGGFTNYLFGTAGDMSLSQSNDWVVSITQSTFEDNSADEYGGAITNFTTLSVENSTFTGNTAPVGLDIANAGEVELIHTDATVEDFDPTPFDFAATLVVRDEHDVSQTLTIGTAPDATTGFDEQYDQFAPPEPPAGAFDARIRHDDEDYLRFFKPTTTVTTTWNVRFQYSEGGEPITISWSPSDFENVDGEFRLLDTFGGDLINVDMREDTAYTVETTTINQVNIIHTMLSTVEIPFDAGWNMIGIPVQKDNTYYQDVFTGAVENSLWGFANGYYNAEELQIGEGYWLRFHEQGEALLTGTPINELEIPLAGDWNMITGISCAVGINDVADPEGIIIAGTLFEFDEVYVETASIAPGNGYWIRTEEEGVITLSCNDSSPQGTITTSALHDAETLSASFHTISITNTRGGTQYLYFGGELDEDVMRESYTLPPLPPQEAFDVRFAGDRYLTEGTEGDIRIQASDEQFPLTVAFEPVDEHTYVITEYRDNEPVGEHILDGMTEIELINSDIDRIGLREYGGEVQDIPEQYALSQNYPNPFNPVTTIQYQLPGETKVRLEVYSMLGQRVTVLVNEVQEAGYYTVEWDGRNASGREVASGVYLYRIQAGEFIETRKLVYIR